MMVLKLESSDICLKHRYVSSDGLVLPLSKLRLNIAIGYPDELNDHQ